MYDYSQAERTNFDLIPAKTIAHIHIAVRAGDQGTPENAFTVTKTGLYQLTLECTVTEGDFARRKIFHRITTGAQPGVTLSEGQEKGIAIGKAFLRSLLEAARGVTSTDESPQAMEARKMSSIFELDNMEVWAEIGIEKGKDGYEDKNTVRRILPTKSGGALAAATTAAPRAATSAAPKARGW